MIPKKTIAAVVWLLMALSPGYARAQATVRLSRSVSPAAARIPNAVEAPDTMPIEISVVLALHNTDQLEQLKRDQQDPSSSSYHKWLTPAEFNARFGPREADADAIAQWLTSVGFSVKSIDLAGHMVRASANAAVIKRAFDTTIVTNGSQYANLDDPEVPAALAPLIATVGGLNNTFGRKPLLPDNLRLGPPIRATDQPGAAVAPDYRTALGLGFSPSDFRTYYNESALISGGIAGTKAPDCIALAAISNIHNSSIGAFTATFGLPAVKLTKVFASGANPGFTGDAEIEADLDIEYSHVTAPNTPIRLYIGAGTNDLLDAISGAVQDNVCGAISISFGYCDPPSTNRDFYNGTLDQIFSQAATQGQTVFISSGDDGAAGLVLDGNQCVPGSSLNVSEMCADPNVTCVGGTQFSPNYDAKFRDTSRVDDDSDAPAAWNEYDAFFHGATGGGISEIFPIPSWQTGNLVPSGTMRMVPDVALGASGALPGFYIVAFDEGANRGGLVSGTSLSSPAWAGYSRLIAQIYGNGGRLGPMNPQLYQLGNTGSVSGLIDVTSGDNTFYGENGYVSGYDAGPGYDMTTGWGSPDMSTMLISYLAGGQATVTPATVSDPPKTVITNAGLLTLANTSRTPLSVISVTVMLTRPTVFKSLSLNAGGQTVSRNRAKTIVFTFSPPIPIAAGGTANFTLGATMISLAVAGAPQSVQSIGPLGISATTTIPTGATVGMTFRGLPASLGSVTLTRPAPAKG